MRGYEAENAAMLQQLYDRYESPCGVMSWQRTSS